MNNLVYNGATINERDEKLSLTDMWRAVGRPEHRDPANWARKEGASFIEYFLTTMPDGQGEQIQALNEGGTWNTWAHWQIGLAYAKYISHEFHTWCNQVVRDHMEGKLRPAPSLEEATHRNLVEHMRRESRQAAANNYTAMSDLVKRKAKDAGQTDPKAVTGLVIQEANLLNEVILGFTSQEFRDTYHVSYPIRLNMPPVLLATFAELEEENMLLIESGLEYEPRRTILSLKFGRSFPKVKAWRDKISAYWAATPRPSLIDRPEPPFDDPLLAPPDALLPKPNLRLLR